MHSVVCIKQVPDSAQIRVHPVTNTIMRQGVPAVINPYVEVVVSAALTVDAEGDPPPPAGTRGDNKSDPGRPA